MITTQQANTIATLTEFICEQLSFRGSSLKQHHGIFYNAYQHLFANEVQHTVQISLPSSFSIFGDSTKIGWKHHGKNYNRALGFPLVGQNENGEYLSVTDHAGFIAYLLEQTKPKAFDYILGLSESILAKFPALTKKIGRRNKPWPTAACYSYLNEFPTNKHYQVLATQDNLAEVLADAKKTNFPKKGDIIAWDGSSGNHINGHVMVVKSLPKQIHSEHFEIEVFDTSSTKHIDDSRMYQGHFMGGTGYGKIQFSWYENKWYIGFQNFIPGHPGNYHQTNRLLFLRF